jgi:hypothetical protein
MVDACGVVYRVRPDLGSNYTEPHSRDARTERATSLNESRSGPFCYTCTASTTSKSAGDLLTVNGSGHMLYGWSGRCNCCQSVIKRLFICLFYVPVWPLARYRVIYSQEESGIKATLKGFGGRPGSIPACFHPVTQTSAASKHFLRTITWHST